MPYVIAQEVQQRIDPHTPDGIYKLALAETDNPELADKLRHEVLAQQTLDRLTQKGSPL